MERRRKGIAVVVAAAVVVYWLRNVCMHSDVYQPILFKLGTMTDIWFNFTLPY